MATVISVKSPKSGKEAEGSYEFGETLQASVGLFGEEVVHSQFVAQATVRAAAVVRGILDGGGDTAKALAALASWKPGVKRTRVAQTPEERLNAAVDSYSDMDEDGRKDFLAKLKASLKA